MNKEIKNKNNMFVKLLGLIIIIILFYSKTYSQSNSESNWIFGNNIYLKFNGSVLEEKLEGSALNTGEGCAVFSKNNGDLLYYTDGQKLFNASHQQVYPPNPNPNSLPDMKGNSTTTQSAIIIPLNNSRFAIVTPDCLTCSTPTENGLWYYLFNSDGSISGSPIQLLSVQTTERVTAVLNEDLDGYWIIAHGHKVPNSYNYYSFSLDINGNVSIEPVISQTNVDHYNNAIGYMRGSPNCDIIAVAVRERIEVLKIDRETGVLSQKMVLVPSKDTSNYQTLLYGVEFSPNGRYLYVSRTYNEHAIIRYDLQTENVQNSEVFIERVDSLLNTDIYCALSLGPDGNIYVARRGKNFIGRISNPNSNNPSYTDNYFSFSGNCEMGLPNFSRCIVNNNTPPYCENTTITASLKSLTINKDGAGNLNLEFLTDPNSIDILNVQIISATQKIYRKRNSNNEITVTGPFSIPVEFTGGPTQIGSSPFLTLQPFNQHSLELLWKGEETINFSNLTNINNIKLLFPRKPVCSTTFTCWDKIKLRLRIKFRDSQCKICYIDLYITSNGRTTALPDKIYRDY